MKRIVFLLGVSVFLVTSYFLIHDAFFINVLPVDTFPLFVVVVSILFIVYYSLRSRDQVQKELDGHSKFLDIFETVSYIAASAFVALSQFLSFELFEAIFVFVFLFAYAANNLPLSGIKVFKTKVFKRLHLPCLTIAAIGFFWGIVCNAA